MDIKIGLERGINCIIITLATARGVLDPWRFTGEGKHSQTNRS
jgi:hypothetical protein